jgi:2-succinyl-5-enolpyruvyl-6-hydroxy-3-cyclohexene-1-carboxylate synthase
MTNLERAASLLAAIRTVGCREIVVCGGSRNAPLVAAIAAQRDVHAWNFFEERSAAFFALGRIRATGAPVAVVTTSGTAAAELLPATIEAHYSGAPLILITADRPARHRGTGAPQAIEQAGLFGPYAAASLDLPTGHPLPRIEWSAAGPLHLNIGFDEPLLDGDAAAAGIGEISIAAPAIHDPEETAAAIARALERAARPLLLVGELLDHEREAVRHFAAQAGMPLYAEPLSGLREDAALEHLALRSGEAILRRAEFDSVIRLGGVPTVRYWRDLDETLTGIPVLSLSSLPFGGLGRGDHLQCDLGRTLPLARVAPRPDREILRADRILAGRLRELFAEKRAEQSIFRALSEAIPEGSLVYLGNSLPIREWDLFATRSRTFAYGANRGANGIDGQISTFLGMAREGRENWCVVGDLTALYDLAAPWPLAQMPESIAVRIVVINNGGGRIFGRVPSLRSVPDADRERLFENPHSIRFDRWAAMWGLDHAERIRPQRALGPRAVIELQPDPDATARFQERYDAVMKGDA